MSQRGGVGSCQATSINSRLLERQHHEYPCAFPIVCLRKEARLKEKLEIGVNNVKYFPFSLSHPICTED